MRVRMRSASGAVHSHDKWSGLLHFQHSLGVRASCLMVAVVFVVPDGADVLGGVGAVGAERPVEVGARRQFSEGPRRASKALYWRSKREA